MKKLGYILSVVTAFFAGVGGGWFLRKKTAEVQFEVISDDEFDKLVANGEEQHPEKIQRPADIQRAIDQHFIVDNADKERMLNAWKANEIASQYDTRSDEISEEEFDEDFLDECGDDGVPIGHPEIEEATIDDWNSWIGTPDGDYDCISINYYEEDHVITDDYDEAVDPGFYESIGFDIPSWYKEHPDGVNGDNDIRIVYNHPANVIYYITLLHYNYGQKKRLEEFGDNGVDDGPGWVKRNE